MPGLERSSSDEVVLRRRWGLLTMIAAASFYLIFRTIQMTVWLFEWLF